MIVSGRPPNFNKIISVFPAGAKNSTIFAYSPYIYVSGKPELSPALNAHENVHISRQEIYTGGAEAWWDRYLTDKNFRLEEELIAHCAEYDYLMKFGSRSERRNALKVVSARLSGPLYHLGLSPKQAAKLIEEKLK